MKLLADVEQSPLFFETSRLKIIRKSHRRHGKTFGGEVNGIRSE